MLLIHKLNAPYSCTVCFWMWGGWACGFLANSCCTCMHIVYLVYLLLPCLWLLITRRMIWTTGMPDLGTTNSSHCAFGSLGGYRTPHESWWCSVFPVFWAAFHPLAQLCVCVCMCQSAATTRCTVNFCITIPSTSFTTIVFVWLFLLVFVWSPFFFLVFFSFSLSLSLPHFFSGCTQNNCLQTCAMFYKKFLSFSRM